jgi:tetrahydromethanopterin S-methyltransferase subunit G
LSFTGGKPSAVILDIDVYQEILERLDDIEDLKNRDHAGKNNQRHDQCGD